VLGGAGAPVDRARAERISVFKSGKYTVERPLHLGAALAGRLEAFAQPFTDYGMPVGLAFQLRDDILGVFGDPSATGKPVGDDLREGKLTPLIVETVQRIERTGTGPERALIKRLIESNLTDSEVAALQELVVSCGALEAVEDQIRDAVDRAIKMIDAAPLDPEARQALAEMAAFVAWREA
jgi:geranylgeranyl diphosphate synthase type I